MSKTHIAGTQLMIFWSHVQTGLVFPLFFNFKNDFQDGTTPMCLSELRIIKTKEELELVDLKKDCYYGFESEVTILRQDVCR